MNILVSLLCSIKKTLCFKVSQNKPANSQTAVTVGNERREKEREIKSSQDVASQLTAMWSNQVRGKRSEEEREKEKGRSKSSMNQAEEAADTRRKRGGAGEMELRC